MLPIPELNNNLATQLPGSVRIISEGSGADAKYYAQIGADAASKKTLGSGVIDTPLRIIGGVKSDKYVSVPTFGRDIRITCTALGQSNVMIHGSDIADFSTVTAEDIRKLTKEVFDISAKDYKYIIIRCASTMTTYFTATIEWI